MRPEVKKKNQRANFKLFMWIAAAIAATSGGTTNFKAPGTTKPVELEIKFDKATMKLGGQTLKIEVATTYIQQARGLMFRKELADNAGMLFIYSEENVLSFWMKNTFIPLSIGFFDKNRILVDVQEMTPVTSEMQQDIPSYKSRKPAMYALEMPSGWFKRHKVSSGAKFELTKEK